MNDMKKKVYLIDGNSFIYRMFFGLPEFSSPEWEVVNAIYWMAKFFVSQLVKESPDYLVFITDAPGKNFRNDLFSEYKATRERMPDNLKTQIQWIHEIITCMGIDIISIPWFEADDVIGTIAEILLGNHEYEVDILTWDKDLYSLVWENVNIYDTMKRKKFWIPETIEKFGVEPQYIIDYLAIVGDKADNIPWIEWFGPKKAISLINALGTIEEIYNIVEKHETGLLLLEDIDLEIRSCFKWKTYEKLVSSKENAFLSKKLATIELNVELDNFDIHNFEFKKGELINEEVLALFHTYGFKSLIPWSKNRQKQKWQDLKQEVTIITNNTDLEKLEKNILQNYTEIVLDTETTGLDVWQAELVWISIFLEKEKVYYINRLHTSQDNKSVSDEALYIFLQNLLTSNIRIIGHNLKYDLSIIYRFFSLLWSGVVHNNTVNNKNTSEDIHQMTLHI